MKARSKNGIVTFYDSLPSNYISDISGALILGFDNAEESALEAEGFFDVITPEYDSSTHKVEGASFNSQLNAFVRNVVSIQAVEIKYKSVLSPYEFRMRFTQVERIAIRTIARTDTVIEDLWDLLQSTTEPNLDDPMMIYGVNLLEQRGLTAPGRAAEILAKYPI